MSDTDVWELKEKAKWSDDKEDKKTAIKELSAYGQAALDPLREILAVTTYDEVRAACVEAIKEIKKRDDSIKKQ